MIREASKDLRAAQTTRYYHRYNAAVLYCTAMRTEAAHVRLSVSVQYLGTVQWTVIISHKSLTALVAPAPNHSGAGQVGGQSGGRLTLDSMGL